MSEFKTYLFDFDGTLVDSYESLVLVFEGAYSKVGVKVPSGYTRRLMRCPLFTGYQELNAPDDDESRRIFGEEIIRLLDEPDVLKATKAYDEVIEVLHELKRRGCRLGIVTSNNKKHVQEVLNFLGIEKDLFSVIVGNKETKKHKPNPDPIYYALNELKEEKKNACYVGDALDDCLSAVNADITPILVDRRNEYSNEFPNIITDLKGLL